MRIEKPSLKELLDLKQLGYFDVRPTQYIEYDPKYLPQRFLGKKEGYLVYADLFEDYRITPISFGNFVGYSTSTPDDFKNHKRYALAVFKNNEKPSKFLNEFYHCRVTIGQPNVIFLKDAVAVTTYDGDVVDTDVLYMVSSMYGNVPVVKDHGELMDYITGKKK